MPWVTYGTRVWCRVWTHGIGDCASIPNWNQCKPSQNWGNGHYIQDLLVLLALIDQLGSIVFQPLCKYATYVEYVKNAYFTNRTYNTYLTYLPYVAYLAYCTYYINTPGVLEPSYSSSKEMKAQSNRLMLLSDLDSTEKSRRSLQYHTLSGLSSNPPDSMPGGLTKTISWRFAILSFFSENGQHAIRCTPGYFLCPIVSEKKILMCPFDLAEFTSCKVSSNARTCEHSCSASNM